MKYFALILFLALIVSSCGPQSPKRSSPPQVLSDAVVAADNTQTNTTPELDILFVVDNSLSMDRHQKNLAANIDQFVQAFANNATIDFHIGVITIWDSDPKHSPLIATKHPLGQLIPLQDPDPKAGRGTALLVNGAMPPRYVTRETQNLTKVLAKTIVLGDDPGPEFEEMFSPVEGFFEPQNLNGPNAGFYRPDAHLLIVFITDANDGSIDVSAEKLYKDLIAQKGDQSDKIHIYTIVSPVDDPNCHKDRAGPPYKFDELRGYSGGQILSLCSSNFGTQLAEFGRDLSVTVARKTIPLIAQRDMNKQMYVTFGSQLVPKAIPPDFDHGWSFDPTGQQILVGGKLNLKPEPKGTGFLVHFRPIPYERLPYSTLYQSPAPAPATNPPVSTGANR